MKRESSVCWNQNQMSKMLVWQTKQILSMRLLSSDNRTKYVVSSNSKMIGLAAAFQHFVKSIVYNSVKVNVCGWGGKGQWNCHVLTFEMALNCNEFLWCWFFCFLSHQIKKRAKYKIKISIRLVISYRILFTSFVASDCHVYFEKSNDHCCC